MPTESTTDAVKLGVGFAGETFIPGAANLVKGDYGQAALHFAAGLAARALLGIPGVIAVSANSLVKAHTGTGLLGHLGIVKPQTSPPPADVPAA
jgi:hypothetical protein